MPSSMTDPSLVDLLKELRNETTELVREEVALAKTEVSEGVKVVGRNVGLLGVGAFVGLLSLVLLLEGLAKLIAVMLVAIDLSPALSEFLGYLAVAMVAGIAAAVVISKALDRLKENPLIPEKTIETLKEDKQWIQEKVQ